MVKSIALAADASRRASLLLSYIPAVCALVAPRQPGASTAIIDRLSHSRALRRSAGAALGGAQTSAKLDGKTNLLSWDVVRKEDPGDLRRAEARTLEQRLPEVDAS